MLRRMSREAITVNLWGTASSNAIRRTKVGMPRGAPQRGRESCARDIRADAAQGERTIDFDLEAEIKWTAVA